MKADDPFIGAGNTVLAMGWERALSVLGASQWLHALVERSAAA